jgi:hypothetical protein
MIHYVITNNGDGSNGVQWVTDPDVLDLMEERADDGDETYASGDGLQKYTLKFPEGFDIEAFLKLNYIKPVTVDDIERYD